MKVLVLAAVTLMAGCSKRDDVADAIEMAKMCPEDGEITAVANIGEWGNSISVSCSFPAMSEGKDKFLVWK